MSIRIQGSFSSSSPHPSSCWTSHPVAGKDPLVHIAVAQVHKDETGLEHDHGLVKLEEWVSKAAELGADIVVFPEYFLSYPKQKVYAQQSDVEAEKEEKSWLKTVANVAVKLDIDIVAGSVVEVQNDIPLGRSNTGTNETQSQQTTPVLYNVCYYVARSGKVLGRYSKQNLWHPERKTLSSPLTTTTRLEQPTDPNLFTLETKRGLRLRASLAICWDLAFYDRFHQMIRHPDHDSSVESGSDLDKQGQMHGPDIIFVPTLWHKSDGGRRGLGWNQDCEVTLVESLCVTRALETESFLILSNAAGPSMSSSETGKIITEGKETDELPTIGHGRSSINAPFLNRIAQLPDEHEALLLQTLDVNVLLDARETYRIRYDLFDRHEK